jgi:hypothetical protein
MAEYLITAADVGGFKKGDVASVRASGAFYGTKEQLPNFVKVKCLEHLLKSHSHYGDSWSQIINYEILVHQVPTDGYRIRVFSTLPGIANEGGLTRDAVEQYLNRWNATVFSIAVNEVVFDLSIFNLATSARFWTMSEDIGDFVFTESSYNELTGEHIIDVDFTQSPRNPTAIERRITAKADNVVSNSGSSIRFVIMRDAILQEFKEEVRDLITNRIETRRYFIADGIVDDIISQGGEIIITDTQFQTYIQDKTV